MDVATAPIGALQKGLAYLNAEGFAKDPGEEAKVKSKVKELGQV